MIKANLDILERDISDRISSFSYYRDNNKTKAFWIVMITAILSAVTTIFIGLSQYFPANSGWPKILSGIALVTSGSITVLSAFDGLFNHKKLWISYVSSLVQFYELQTDIKHYKSSGEESQEIVDKFYLRYKEILGEVNSNWLRLRTESAGEKSPNNKIQPTQNPRG